MGKLQQEGDKVIQRTLRVNQSVWFSTKAKAAYNGLTMSDVIRSLLEKWLNDEVKIVEDQK